MILKNVGKVCFITSINIILLFILAPIIDHAFTPLHKEETNMEILFEIITQLLTISVIWFILDKYILYSIHKYLNIHNNKLLNTSTNIVSAVILIGLQSHLIEKLEYITHEHPFRFLQVFSR